MRSPRYTLCCVSPSSKETTLHYFRDPLVAALAADADLRLTGAGRFGGLDAWSVVVHAEVVELSLYSFGVLAATLVLVQL